MVHSFSVVPSDKVRHIFDHQKKTFAFIESQSLIFSQAILYAQNLAWTPNHILHTNSKNFRSYLCWKFAKLSWEQNAEQRPGSTFLLRYFGFPQLLIRKLQLRHIFKTFNSKHVNQKSLRLVTAQSMWRHREYFISGFWHSGGTLQRYPIYAPVVREHGRNVHYRQRIALQHLQRHSQDQAAQLWRPQPASEFDHERGDHLSSFPGTTKCRLEEVGR